MGDQDKPYEGWAVVELFGHRRLGGRVCQAEQYGVAMLRVDVSIVMGKTIVTQFYGGSSIYGLTPCSEEAAMAVARANQVEPVSRWELPQLEAPKVDLMPVACEDCKRKIMLPYGVMTALCSDCVSSCEVDAAGYQKDDEPDV